MGAAIIERARARWIEAATLLAVLLQHARGFHWVARTWRDATYESFGFLALALLLPSLLSAPARRATPSTRHLAALLVTALCDLALAPLGLNLVSALLGVLRLHLWALAFRDYPGPFWRHAQLWLGLLTLPVVHWANVLVGFRLQQLVTAIAAGGLRLYGLPAAVHGTTIELGGATVAVDASCSGLKLIYSGVLFGLLVLPRLHRRRLLFSATLLLGLLGANVVRVISLAVAQLQLGRPLDPSSHEGVGLIAFALACALSLLVRPRAGHGAPLVVGR
jgi:exosortase